MASPDFERDVCERLRGIERGLGDLVTAVDGNGQPGLQVRLSRLEGRTDGRRVAGLGGLAGAVIAFLGAVIAKLAGAI